MVANRRNGQPGHARRGFTLIEMLVAITIIVVIMVTLFSVSAGVANIWKSSSGKISSFQNARLAFSTLSETLSRATLNTYNDYAATDASGNYYFRHADVAGATPDDGSITRFKPTRFARASELHFVSGPTADFTTLGPKAQTNPGHAVFFHAPLGFTKGYASDGSTKTNYTGLKRMLNSVGFYIKYDKPEANLLPTWLADSAAAKARRFRLVQYVQESEQLQIYTATAGSKYTLDWLNFAKSPLNSQTVPSTRVLAEDVLLLVLRPRLSPGDERSVATRLKATTYQPDTKLGSLLSPNYQYDSRAWMSDYPMGSRVYNDGQSNPALKASDRAKLMMNQLPSVIDLAIVCADSQSLARPIYSKDEDTPHPDLQVPDTLFKDSALMEQDLNTYADQLSKKNIRFHIQRSAVELRGAKWSNE